MRKLLTTITLSLALMFTSVVPVFAAEKPTPQNASVLAIDQTYLEWDAKKEVPVNKVWSIKFNSPVLASTVNAQNIYVVNSGNLTQKTTLTLASDNKTIKVNPPIEGYKPGVSYTLYILKSVSSANPHIALKSNIKMKFTIEFAKAQGNIELATISDFTIARVTVKSADIGTHYSYNGTTKAFGEVMQFTATGLNNVEFNILDAAGQQVGILTVNLVAGDFESAITLISSLPTISSISDISKTINQGDTYSLPSTVEATMSDGSKKQVAVTWTPSDTSILTSIPIIDDDNNYADLMSSLEKQMMNTPDPLTIGERDTSKVETQILTELSSIAKRKTILQSTALSSSTINTSKAGTYTFQGSVDGYSKQVILTLTIKASAIMTDSQFQTYLNANYGSLTIDGLTVRFNWEINKYSISGTDVMVTSVLDSIQYLNWLKWCTKHRHSTIESFLEEINTKVHANYPNKKFFGGVQYQDYWSSYPSSFPINEISYSSISHRWLVTHTCASIYSFDGKTTGVIVKNS